MHIKVVATSVSALSQQLRVFPGNKTEQLSASQASVEQNVGFNKQAHNIRILKSFNTTEGHGGKV